MSITIDSIGEDLVIVANSKTMIAKHILIMHILMKSWGELYTILILIGVTCYSLPSSSDRSDVWWKECVMPVLWIYAALAKAAPTLSVWIIPFFSPETCSSWLFALHACRITPGIPFGVDQLCLPADKSQEGLGAARSKDCSNRREGCHAFQHTAHAFIFLPSRQKLDRHQGSHLARPFRIEILIFKEL